MKSFCLRLQLAYLIKHIKINSDSLKSIRTIDISPSGKYLGAVCKIGQTGYECFIWDLHTNELIFHDSRSYIYKMQFSPDEQHFVLSDAYPKPELKTNYIYLYSTNPMKYEGVLGTHDAAITDLCFSHDGKYLASAGWDAKIKIWDFEKRELKQNFFKENTNYRCLAYSTDDKYLIIGLMGGGISAFNINKNEFLYNYPDYIGALTLDVSIDGRYIAAGTNKVYLLNNMLTSVDNSSPDSKIDTIIYPNPITNEAIIIFNLPHSCIVNINLTNITGQIVKNVYVGNLEAGANKIRFDATELLSGVYFCRIQCGKFSETAIFVVRK